MKLLVDEMPNYKDDCLFAEQRWDGEWITYCKLTNIRCDLDEEECRCLKVQKIYGNEYNCIMTMFGECSYSETGCGDCAVVEKVRKALKKSMCDTCRGKSDCEKYDRCYGYKEGIFKECADYD